MIKVNYDVVLFDLDGTVIDSLLGILNAFNYCFEKNGIKKIDENEILPFIGPPIIYTLENDFGMNKDDAQRSLAFYHEYYADKGWKEFKVLDGIEDLLIKLRDSGKTIALATNKPRHYAVKMMEYCNLSQYFHYIGGSDYEKGITNKTLVINDCLQNLKIQDKSKVIMIGDRKFDVVGATGAEINTIGITHGYGDREELIKYGAIIIVDTPNEIISLF